MSTLHARIEHNHLVDAVAWTARCAGAFKLSPLLAGVLVESIGDELQFSAFNYEVSATIRVPAIVDAPGRVVVSARLLERITKVIPSGTVTLVEDDTHVLQLTAGGKFGLPTLVADDYPQLPELPPLIGEIPADEWAAAIRRVAIAAGNQDAAPHWLSTIRVEFGEHISMVGTNRYQLSTAKLAWQPVLDGTPNANIQVSADIILDHAKNLRGDSPLAIHHSPTSGVIAFSSAGRHATLRLSADEYNATWRRVIPVDVPITVAMPVKELGAALRRVETIGDNPGGNVVLELDLRELRIIMDQPAPTGGTGQEALPVDYDGESIAVRVRAEYMREALAQVGNSETVVLGFTNPKAPVVVKRLMPSGAPDSNATFLVMPIRLDAPAPEAKAARRAA